jgi:hypothetical protein
VPSGADEPAVRHDEKTVNYRKTTRNSCFEETNFDQDERANRAGITPRLGKSAAAVP